jgi:hypothetical protein
MKSRTTWFLLWVTLAVAGYVSWDLKKGTTTDQARQQQKRLVELKAADVTGLELAHTNQTVELQKAGGQWLIKKPSALRASQGAVNSLLDELELAERERLLTGKDLDRAQPADFGLEKPWLKITVQRAAGPLTVLIGAETPTKDAYFIQVAGQKEIQVAAKSIATRLDRSLDDLRERTVVDFTPAAATRLEIKNRDRVVELAKSATDKVWALSRPLAGRADQSKASELLGALSNLRVTDFVSEDTAAARTHHLDEPVTEVTVWTGDAGQTVLFGPALTNDATKVYAKLKGAASIFTVPADAAQKFVLQVNDVRDRKVLPVAEADVQGIQIIAAGQELTLARTGGVWRVTAPQAIAAEDSEVSRLLEQLTGLSVQQFIADVPTDLEKFGLATPAVTVSLQGQGTNVLAQLLVGGADDSNGWRFVKRASETFVYGVDANLGTWLPTGIGAVRTRQLVDVKSSEIKKLTVQKGLAQVVVERNADGRWQLVEPAQGVLDIAVADRLAEALASLRAEEFLETKPAESGLDAPEVVITTATGAISLGKPAGPGKCYAAWGDPALVFTLAESTAQTLAAPFVTIPTPPPVEPATNAPPVAVPAQ